jgi:hypothetical protein
MAGGLSFEIILTLIIAALTGGAGAAAVAAKNMLLIGKLEKAGQALLTIGKKLKSLKVRAKRKLISVKNSLTSSGSSPKSKHDAVDEVMHKASEKPKSADTRPPITYAPTLAEAKQRLIDAGPAVDKALANKSPLPQSVFSLEDKQKVVADGIKDRYLVRVIESSHVKPEGYIARKQDYGTLSFTAPLSMVEHGDTNAQALLNAFGTRHDPTKSYSILIIDREKMEALGDVQTVVPTFDNLEDLVEKNPALTKVSESTRRQVLKEEFKADYYSFSKGLKRVDQSDDNAMLAAAMSQGHSLEKATLLLDRHKLAKDLSIWEEFTGNGMTLDTNGGATLAKGPFGPVEAVMLDKAPKTLGELQAADAIEIIKAR